MKVAFIGSGNMAKEHAKVFSRISDVEIVSVQSPTKDNRGKFSAEFDIPSFSSISDLYEATQPDALIVCVPPDKVGEILKTTLQYPAFQLVEKPVGLNTNELNELIRIELEIHDSPRVYAALNRRHYASVLELKRRISISEQSIHLTIIDQEDVIEARNYGHNSAVLENWEFANSIHLIDLALFLCRGEISNMEITKEWDRYSPSVKLANIQFDSGDTCFYQGVWNRPAPWTITASMNEGYYSLKPIEVLEVILPESRMPQKIIEISSSDFKVGLMEQALSFISATKNQSFSLPSLRECLPTYELIDRIYGS